MQLQIKHKYVHYKIGQKHFLKHSKNEGSSSIKTPSLERIFFTFVRTFSILSIWVIVFAENIKSNL